MAQMHVSMMTGLVTLRTTAAVAGTLTTCRGTCHGGVIIMMMMAGQPLLMAASGMVPLQSYLHCRITICGSN
eukprot:scaffold5893_cov154-Skeletonema_dohrnii-CCMP3373.AAC.4